MTVDATRYAVTTHDRWFRPPRSPTMVGSAVATMVWSSAASSMPSMSPPRMTMICRWVYVLGCTCPAPCSAATQSSLPFDVLDEPFEQVGQAGAVGRVPSGEHLPEGAVARPADAGDELLAPVRGRDDRGPAVARIVGADDEARGLELRHLAARGRDVEPDPVGELRDPGRLPHRLREQDESRAIDGHPGLLGHALVQAGGMPGPEHAGERLTDPGELVALGGVVDEGHVLNVAKLFAPCKFLLLCSRPRIRLRGEVVEHSISQTSYTRNGNGGAIPAMMVRPAAARGALPAVIVIHEAWGADAHIRDVAGRIASAGYLAFVPDLYAHGGTRPPELAPDRIDAFKRFTDGLSSRDPEARERALAELPETERERIEESRRAVHAGMERPERFVEDL